MADGAEKSIEETRRDQALDIERKALWDCRREEHEGISDANVKEHIEECMGEMLNSYIDDKRNYVLNEAVISCDQMSDKMIFVQFREDGSKISIEEGKEEITSNYKKPADIGPESYNSEGAEYFISSHIEDEYIRKLYAVHGSEQSANDIPFATVIDRTSLREAEETTGVDSALAEEGKAVSIIGCGNCGILNEKDIEKIAENWDSVRKYGTCYLFIKPDLRWSNPYCMESVVGECSEDDFLSSATDIVGCMAKKVTCTTEHHKTMRFSTEEGEQEGLTMMSTLLCTRGGIITIEASGQLYIKPKTYEFKYDWAKKGLPGSNYITPDFLERVVEIARELEIDPDDLMAVMAWESWFDPNQRNPRSGAYGLIQFTDISLDEINQKNGKFYKKDDLRQMSMLDQLELVYLHYKPKAGLMHDLGDVYLVTIAPMYVNGDILDDSLKVYTESDGDKYTQNRELDKEGKGFITKSDLVQQVIDRREYFLYED